MDFYSHIPPRPFFSRQSRTIPCSQFSSFPFASPPIPLIFSQTHSQPPSQDFPSFYLSSVTAAFADDLEKLRLASDFKDSSVPILIEALKQGAEIYGEKDRGVWMGR